MAAHLTDKQKKMIVADYVEMGSYNAVAKKHGVSLNTVKNIVLQNADIAEKLEQKKEQNSADMLAYMDSRKEKAQKAFDKLLDAMLDDEKIAKAPLSQIATAFGIIVDKFVKADQVIESIPSDRLLEALGAFAQDLFTDGDDSHILPNQQE